MSQPKPFLNALYILKKAHNTDVPALELTPSTARMYYRFTKCFLDYCQHKTLEPQQATLNDVQLWLATQTWKASTTNAAISALRWSCQYTHNHIPGLSSFPTQRAYFPIVDDLLTAKQLATLRLLPAIALSRRLGLRNRAILLLVIDTLADEEEIQKLCIIDIIININNNNINNPDGSVNLLLRSRSVASPILAADTRQAISLYLTARLKKYVHCEASEALFISERNRCMSSPTMWRVFHKATQLLKLRENTQTSRSVDSGFSLVRASQARQLYLQQKADIPTLMVMLRKNDAKTVLRMIRELL